MLFGKWLIEAAEQRKSAGLADGNELNVDSGGGATKYEPHEAEIKRDNESVVAVTGTFASPKSPGSRGIVPLRIGDAVIPLSVSGTTEEIGRARASADEEVIDPSLEETWWDRARDIDLELIEARCRLKARSCELYVARNALSAGGDDPEQRQRLHDEISELLRVAKATKDCFLWVLWRERLQPADDVVSRIALCYRALAEAAGAMRRVDNAGDRAGDGAVASAMQLLAEANSALRVALEETWLTAPDKDQDETHLWLKRETAARRIFISRHMTITDPGDPVRATGLISEVRSLAESVAKRIASSKGVESAITKLKYHVVKATADKDEYQFDKIAETLDALLAMGISPRDRRVVESIPAALAAEFPARLMDRIAVKDAVAAALKRAKPAKTVAEDDGEEEQRAAVRVWSARVAEARGLVEGRAVVMVGGEPRNEAIDRLKSAFGLSRVDWVHLTEHGSSDGLRGPITRPDCAAVLVLIKLTGHLHADEAQRYARTAGRPCVYLTAGYNPEQVAEALLQQAGERLRERAG